MTRLLLIVVSVVLALSACQSNPKRWVAGEVTSDEPLNIDEYNRQMDLASNRQNYLGQLTIPEGSTLSPTPSKEINQTMKCLVNINNDPIAGSTNIYVGLDSDLRENQMIPNPLKRGLMFTTLGGVKRPLKTGRSLGPYVGTEQGKAWGQKNAYEKYDSNSQKFEYLNEISSDLSPNGFVYVQKTTAIVDPDITSIPTAMIEIYYGSRQSPVENLALQARFICTPQMLGFSGFSSKN